MVPKNLESLLALTGRYPPLFHYTREDSAMALLESRSLLARPTWKFNDTDEYVLGLRMILDRLKLTKSARRDFNTRVGASGKSLVRRYFSDFANVLEMVIALIEHELGHVETPKIEVFVACLTTNAASTRMVSEYGNVIISFNFLLPHVAYSCPEPFALSMLSWVTYSAEHFKSKIIELGFDLSLGRTTDSLVEHLDALPEVDQRHTLAIWIAESLCSLAPNIKRESFEWEREWRLKSIRSHYGEKSLSALRPSSKRLTMLDLPSKAKFLDGDPPRYLHQLTVLDQFISQGIVVVGGSGVELGHKINAWQAEYSMPRLDREQFAAAAARSQAGNI